MGIIIGYFDKYFQHFCPSVFPQSQFMHFVYSCNLDGEYNENKIIVHKNRL